MLSVYDMTPNQIRADFGKCAESFHKQMGLRKIRGYKLLEEKNPEQAAKLLAEARNHLAYARVQR